MSAARPLFFCLATGAALGGLFLLFRALRILLHAGKVLTAVLDVLFCCLCAASVFLCALAMDHGRLRLFQAVFQLLGGWAAVQALGPFTDWLAGKGQKIFCRISALFRKGKTFLTSLFQRRRRKPAKKRKKARQKPKKAKKKT